MSASALSEHLSDEPAQGGRLRKVVDGLCVFDTLNLQLQVHANDSLERESQAQQFDMPPQLTIMLLLEGDLQVSVNGNVYRMSAQHGPVGHLWLLAQPGKLVRHTKKGQRVRKVNATLSLDGVESIDLPAELKAHICLDSPRASIARWTPSPNALRCAHDLLSQHATPSGLRSLQTCIAGLSLFQQAVQAVQGLDRVRSPEEMANLSDRDAERARRIRECIQQHDLREPPSPQALANAFGMSVSTLQRLFKAAYGMSVMEFTRKERLQSARKALLQGRLTVGEAGYRAGYNTASNFSTAFQRTFGYPPSACVT
jgi:AraC-like DNA-binding protein